MWSDFIDSGKGTLSVFGIAVILLLTALGFWGAFLIIRWFIAITLAGHPDGSSTWPTDSTKITKEGKVHIFRYVDPPGWVEDRWYPHPGWANEWVYPQNLLPGDIIIKD